MDALQTPGIEVERQPSAHDKASSSASIPSVSSPSVSSPSLGSLDMALLDQAYDEYCDCLHRGEWPDAKAFCERYPSVKKHLYQLLLAHQVCGLDAAAVTQRQPVASFEPGRWPERGDDFGRYHLLGELGRGAFARVFLAADASLGDRLVAIKIAQGGGDEARLLGPIKHPNIVPVYAIEEDRQSGLTAVCMPYVGSATLSRVCAEVAKAPAPPAHARFILDIVADAQVEPTPGSAALPIMTTGTYVDGIRAIGAQVADALAYIHQRGIVHLDLKPSNVLLGPDGVPMVLDFNLASNAEAGQHRVGGTIAYSSPEQLRSMARLDDAGSIDARSDLFSLGVMLYQLLTGKHPFEVTPDRAAIEDVAPALLKQQQDGPTPVRTLNPQVDRALARLIERCLAFAPADRPASAAEIAVLLRSQLTPTQRASRWLLRHPGRVGGALLGLIAAVLLALAPLAARPPHDREQYRLGLAALHQGQYAKAISHFTQVIEVVPNDTDAYYARARARQKLDTNEGWRLALADYMMTDQLIPSGRSKASIGYCLTRLGQAGVGPETPKYYQDAIDLGYAPAEVFNNLAHCQMKANDPKEARLNLDRAVQTNGQLQIAFHNRAFLSLREIVDAVGGGKNKQKLAPKDLLTLASGIADVEKAVELGPMSADLAFDAARLHALDFQYAQGDKSKAIRYLEIGIKEHHMNLDRLKEVLFDCLRGERAFQMLVAYKHSANTPQMVLTPRSVDPGKDPGR